jgi:hypothetical protein
MAQEPFVRIPAPAGEQRYGRREREERETDVWIRQVQATLTPESGSMWVHVGDPRADMFPFCRSLSGDANALSGASGEVTARTGERSRDQLFADAGTILSEPGEPSLRGSRQAWSPSAFDPVAACLWADDTLATPKRPARKQGARDRVGHACLGRAGERCRGATGMGLADFGPYHHARTSVGGRGLVSASVAGRGLSALPQKWVSH